MTRNYQLYLQDILESIEKIQQYICKLTFEEFSSNNMVIDAVVRNLEIIGEAATRMPDDIRLSYSQIPWAEMRGIRNILVHEYFGVDHKIIWKTAKQSLPELSLQIKNITQKLKTRD